MTKTIEQLCSQYNLGLLISAPKQVSGGLLHTMYRVVTNLGEYAVKVLNPEIMQRREAMQNMVHSEMIADMLKYRVPLVAAIDFDGEKVIEIEGTFFCVFDWQEGEAIYVPDITAEHCAQIGRILGRIHVADIAIPGVEKSTEGRGAYEWDKLLDAAKEQNFEIFSVFSENLQSIIKWDKAALDSQQEILQEQVISHRDLDPKNVMWQEGNPYVIDWESAGYVNPYQELIEVLNYWIKDAEGGYDKKKFDALIQSYAVRKDIMHVNWKAVLNSGFDGMLGWLEYSMKRALGFTGAKSDDVGSSDREEGMKQVIGTIAELKKFEVQKKKLYAWILEFMEV